MSDHIFTKRFDKSDRKNIGCCAIFFYFIILLGISSSLRLHLHLLSLTGGDLKMDMADDGTIANNKMIVAEYLQLPMDAAQDNLIASATYFNTARCKSSTYCEIDGEARVDGNSSTVYILVGGISNSTNSWIIEPTCRPRRPKVKKWRVQTIAPREEDGDAVPKCTQYHNHPAILFSIRGYAGNFFHDFADVLFPLYLTSSGFKGEVQFVVTDHKPWWIGKYRQILNKLTNHGILDIDGETSQVHCFNKMRIGLRFYESLLGDPSESPPPMPAFRGLLREAYSLKRGSVARGDGARARLMIIDRKYTRVLTNARQVSSLAVEMGFEVVVVEPAVETSVPAFAEAVNSCDVLMGVHGAGLTNMVFLPDNAVLIQVILYGLIDSHIRVSYGNPSLGMKLRYLEYKIREEESSLSQKYSMDHPILKNPESFRDRNESWRPIYLRQQNVTIDVHRFKDTLVKALKLLHR